MWDPASGALGVRPASSSDVESLHRIRRAAEQWLAARGVQQWNPGEVSPEDVAAQVARGEWFVTCVRGSVVAGLRFLDRDPEVWPGDQPGQARYVHGLMVDRDLAAPGTGATLLRWAEGRAGCEGTAFMRLDCVESNAKLREFYTRLGYREVGRRDFEGPWFSATLFEKPLR